MTLLRQIEIYLRNSGLAPTSFGRFAAHDPRFVFDLRKGREVGASLATRVQLWMQEHSA